MKQELQQKIEATLRSLDGVERATANPFLFARIVQRVQAAPPAYLLPARWGWQLAAVLLVMAVLNFFTIRHLAHQAADSAGASALATEYSINPTPNY